MPDIYRFSNWQFFERTFLAKMGWMSAEEKENFKGHISDLASAANAPNREFGSSFSRASSQFAVGLLAVSRAMALKFPNCFELVVRARETPDRYYVTAQGLAEVLFKSPGMEPGELWRIVAKTDGDTFSIALSQALYNTLVLPTRQFRIRL
jgi:hypothetical protein